jgi:hypothetical protein
MTALFAESAWTQGVVYITPSQPLYYGPGQSTQNIDITWAGCTNFLLVCEGGGPVLFYPLGSNNMIVAPIPDAGPLDAGYTLVAALNQGDVIGSNPSAIQSGDQWFDVTTSPTVYSQIGDEVGIDGQIYTVGYFVGRAVAYIGIEIVQNGSTYYGWMEVQNPFPMVGGEIVQWAYSTVPNAPIVAGAGLLVAVAPVQIVRPGNLRLNWQSQDGQAYQVQFKDQLDAPCWRNTDLTVIATATNSAADVPIVGAARFYRVIQVQ